MKKTNLQKCIASCLTLSMLISQTAFAAVIPSETAGTSEQTQTEATAEENKTIDLVIEIAPQTTTEIPLTEGGTSTAIGTEEGTIIHTSENSRQRTNDTEYTHMQEVVVNQGNVTITTKEITVTENVEIDQSDLTHVKSETPPTATNDLIIENASAADLESLAADTQTGGTETPEPAGGYQYVYAGTGNTSQFRPAVVFTEPLTEEELQEFHNLYIPLKHVDYFPTDLSVKDENGNYVIDEEEYLLDANGNRIPKSELTVVSPDGTTYYLHRIDLLGTAHNVEGWFQDGEWIEEINGDPFGVVYSTAQQFVLVDQATGELVTVYCADISTETEKNYGYNIENLEDADYYTDEQAEQIRTIASNGYWGSADNGIGSLEAMKEMLRNAVDENGNRIFTDEEIDNSLTDGVALTATQMAIWSCSNAMSGVEFINTHYTGNPADLATDKVGGDALGNIPAEKEDETALMFKIYEYLKSMEPTAKENTTADTIINADNFLKELSVTVVEKAENHENNMDTDDTNDAYVTDLVFALVVTPSTENGDDLIVKVLDANGNPIAEGRIAGEANAGEQVLTPDENGNYTFSGITMVEGDQNFNITLEGVQNLSEGVYLYTSEVRTDDSGNDTSSQTMVGLARGKRDVSVEMNIRFELNVEDDVIATEYYRITRKTPPPEEHSEQPPAPKTPESEVPYVEVQYVEVPEDEFLMAGLVEEEIPLGNFALTALPKTGDASLVWLLISALSGFCLAGMSLVEKKREDEY